MTTKEFNEHIHNAGTDDDGFVLIYRRFYDGMFYSAYTIVNEVAMAEDVVSQVFFKLYNEKPTKYIDNPKAWLRGYGIKTLKTCFCKTRWGNLF